MKILSAKHSVFIKWVLPVLAFLFACAWAQWSNSRKTHPATIGESLAAIGLLGIVFVVVLRRDLWSMADTVEDRGDRLVVTRRRKRVDVPICNVSSVDRIPRLVGEQVTLRLKQPCELGSEIVFLSPVPRRPSTIDSDLESLANRVRQAGA